MEDADQQPETANARTYPDKEVTLHYIDKSYSSLLAVWSLANRIFISVTVLSVLLLFLAIGIVSADDTFTILGIDLRVSPTILLASGMIAIASLLVVFHAAMLRETVLGNEIVRLYWTIGYVQELDRMRDDLSSPFFNIHIVGVATSSRTTQLRKSPFRLLRMQDASVTLAVASLTLILPALAEIAALVRFVHTVGWSQYWLWIPLILCVLVSIVQPIASIVDDRRIEKGAE